MLKKIISFILLNLSIGFAIAQTDDDAIALQLVRKNMSSIGLTESDIKNSIVSNSYFNKIAGTRMVYLQQSYKDLPVYNQILVLAFKNELLVSKTGSRIQSIEKLSAGNNGTPAITAEMALLKTLSDRKISYNRAPLVLSSEKSGRFIVFDNMGVSNKNITAELMWVPLEDGKKVALAWQVYVIPNTSSDYWMVRVNAIDNSIVGVSNLTVSCNWDDPKHENKSDLNNHKSNNATSFKLFDLNTDKNSSSPELVSNVSYRVVAFPVESPSHAGGTPILKSNPWTAASGNATTLKWHNDGTTDYNYTRGNNVWAQEDRDGNNGTGTPATSTTTGDPLTFDFTPVFTATPTQTTPAPNQQFNITNLFYWNNIIHDITYQYGFDEVSGNFQASNQSRGGLGNDYVFADAQDGSGTNNANFSTPADGDNGRMQMYLWSGSPQKDGDADNGVITHEYAHGISNRLTGGPSQAGCLQNEEQMGEGWSDYFALMYTQNWATATLTTGFSSPRPVGTYVVGQSPTGNGIRTKKYCTNFSINNLVYASTISSESHNRGEIWCATLWDMTWNIINQVGTINPNIYNANIEGGNSIALKLVIEGMRLQPCSPGFIDGRDAILQADQILYNGAYSCAIREAFRRRGMGAFASQGSSSSVTDQVADYSTGGATLQLLQNVIQIPEGQNIVYTNRITTNNCGGISNFTLTDTLPSNVTYISGGSYNTANRVVSFPVTVAAGQTQDFTFTVKVNNGSYYPTVHLFEDQVTGTSIPSTWTTSSTTRANWTVSSERSFSPTKSYYSSNLDTISEQRLTLTNAITLGATPPPLTFRHWFNSESTYDGGVLEVSTNGGTTWTDMQSNIIMGGYTVAMDASTALTGRRAWSGSSNGQFIKTKVNLTPYANQSIKIRFRFNSDLGTKLIGWYVDDIAFKDQAVVEMQSNLFTISNVKVATSDTVTVILPAAACTTASISTQPANVSICSGSSTTLSVAAAGSSLTYQWQISTNGGASFSNISGATSSTFTISNATSSLNNNQYRVVVSNDCPSTVTSDAAVLLVNTPASISNQPANQSICSGESATFVVTAAGSANTYQWQVSTNNGTTFTDISGATGTSLSLTNVDASFNNNQYHVVISSCSPNSVISSNVTLTVNSAALITNQPTNQSACEGSNAVFAATITGNSISYQWQISTDGGATFTDITGATGASLTIANITAVMNNNRYRVKANSSSCPGVVTSTAATLTVSDNPVISAQPNDINVCPGANGSLFVTASGTSLSYQWQISTDGGVTFTDLSGENNAVLNLTNLTAADDGNIYRAVISSACSVSGIVTNNATLHISNAPSIINNPENINACENSAVTFSSIGSGNGLTYQWQISNDGGINFTNISGANNSSYTIPSINTAMNNSQFRVIASGTTCGSVTSTAATLNVATAATIINQPQDTAVCSDSNAEFSVNASGTGLSYQWQISTDNGNNFIDTTGEISNRLNLTEVNTSMNDVLFKVIVTSAACGSIESETGKLTVYAIPSVDIIATPTTVVLPGRTVTLSVSSSTTANTYTWYFNGSILSGQNQNTITVNEDNIGQYYVTISDLNGCSNSSPALQIKDTVISTSFIFPNPNNGKFKVKLDANATTGSNRIITMYDSKGARVYKKQIVSDGPGEIVEITDTQRLSGGFYVLVLSDSNENTIGKGTLIIE